MEDPAAKQRPGWHQTVPQTETKQRRQLLPEDDAEAVQEVPGESEADRREASNPTTRQLPSSR